MREKWKVLVYLHTLLLIYSVSGIFSKLAAQEPFLSFKFCIFYCAVILSLGIYALGWQQILKRLPLITAYSNKAITIIWGVLWGMIFFHEMITLKKVLGMILIIIGILFFAKGEAYE